MRSLYLTKEALDFIRDLEPKPFKQVMNKVLSLVSNPTPTESSSLKGYESLYRVDMGEHRIVYRFDDESASVLIVDKRKDAALKALKVF